MRRKNKLTLIFCQQLKIILRRPKNFAPGEKKVDSSIFHFFCKRCKLCEKVKRSVFCKTSFSHNIKKYSSESILQQIEKKYLVPFHFSSYPANFVPKNWCNGGRAGVVVLGSVFRVCFVVKACHQSVSTKWFQSTFSSHQHITSTVH